MDLMSESDPMVVVFLKDAKTDFKEIGRTEVVKDNPNPDFKARFLVDYYFEEQQEMMFQVYDADSVASAALKAHDFVGAAGLSLGELVAKPGQVTRMALMNKAKPVAKASITLRLEEVKDASESLEVIISAKKLPKMDFFGSCDPFLRFFKHRPDTSLSQEYETEVIKGTLTPKWKQMNLKTYKLCGGDYSRNIVVKAYDWNKSGEAEYIGEFSTSVQELLGKTKDGKDFKENRTFILTRPDQKNPKKRSESRGEVTFEKCILRKEQTFLDFIAGGLQIGLMVAIDFTGSNGHPDDYQSLHYRGGGQPNQYQQAITAIGNIVAAYDSDGSFPVWGFGAKVGAEVSHCFPLTFDPSRPEVLGVQGILTAYHHALSRIMLSGPTLFERIIRSAAAIASRPYSAGFQHYSILLIITDGVINDMDQTIQAIIEASRLPLSIIIVGVGNADFGQMNRLDSDGKLLSLGGKQAARDIVQFVPMMKFKGAHPSLLAKETLAEVPSQVLSYMKQNNILANPPRPAPAVSAYGDPPLVIQPIIVQPTSVVQPIAVPMGAMGGAMGGAPMGAPIMGGAPMLMHQASSGALMGQAPSAPMGGGYGAPVAQMPQAASAPVPALMHQGSASALIPQGGPYYQPQGAYAQPQYSPPMQAGSLQVPQGYAQPYSPPSGYSPQSYSPQSYSPQSSPQNSPYPGGGGDAFAYRAPSPIPSGYAYPPYTGPAQSVQSAPQGYQILPQGYQQPQAMPQAYMPMQQSMQAQQPLPQQSQQPQPAAAREWKCSSCTYANKVGVTKCEMCGVGTPSA